MASSEKMDNTQVVSDQFLQYLAGELTAEWLGVARYLKISEGMLYDKRTDNIGHVKEAKYQMLLCWKRKDGQNATHNILAKAFLKAGRKDLADEVWNEEGKARKQSSKMEPSSEQASSHLKRQLTTEEHPLNLFSIGGGHMTADMKNKKSQFLTEMKNKYTNLCGQIQPAPFLRDKYDIDELFVEGGITFLEGKQGESKEQEKWTDLKKYKMIFTDPKIKSMRRIIDGEPGYGKSTLALQITHDWCQGVAPMNEFQILILLRLRQFRNVPTVFSAIKKFLLPKDSKLTEDDIESILDISSTVILLEGYDEYPDRGKEDTDIEHIIRGDMFLKHEVILTTRTSCLPPSYSRDTKRIRLTGFDDTSRITYIRNVVARGCSHIADKINHFLKVSPVPADICKIPLFFAMICYMVKNSESLRNLKTEAQFFRHIIKCFHCHRKAYVTDGNREKELDHSKLDQLAFEGLSDDAQQLSWDKNNLRGKIEEDLYDEYVRIGILVEEEDFDSDTLEYKTETRFFHKLFTEWYAAHYLAKVAAQPETKFELWYQSLFEMLPNDRSEEADMSQPHEVAIREVHSLKSLNPHDLHYVYRYACGLNSDAALKIIQHLGTDRNFAKYTLLCITEWGGNLEAIMDTVTSLCSNQFHFTDRDSLLLQRSAAKVIEFAISRKIPITMVYMHNCLDVDSSGNLRVKPLNWSLPVINNLRWLTIDEYGREMTEKETDSILQYSAKCLGLKRVQFNSCLLPRYIKMTESYMSVLRSRNIEVLWDLGGYHLNLESGQWEYFYDRKPMTDEQYQEVVKKTREKAKVKEGSVTLEDLKQLLREIEEQELTHSSE